jgi:hypothetical protein
MNFVCLFLHITYTCPEGGVLGYQIIRYVFGPGADTGVKNKLVPISLTNLVYSSINVMGRTKMCPIYLLYSLLKKFLDLPLWTQFYENAELLLNQI